MIQYWQSRFNTEEQFKTGKLIGSIVKDGKVTTADVFDFDIDAKGMIWVAYESEDGSLYIAKSNKELVGWESNSLIGYVPTGSANPSVAINSEGLLMLAAEYKAAGGEPEIWVTTSPGAESMRSVCDGQSPIIACFGDVFYLFYQTPDKNSIYYRKSTDNFATATLLPTVNAIQPVPLSARTIIYKAHPPYHYYHRYMFFFKAADDTLRYSMGNLVDIFVPLEIKSFGQIFTGAALSKMEWQPMKNYQINISGDIQTAAIPKLEWIGMEKHKIEILGSVKTNADLSGIEWIGINVRKQAVFGKLKTTAGLESVLWIKEAEHGL